MIQGSVSSFVTVGIKKGFTIGLIYEYNFASPLSAQRLSIYFG